MSECPFHSRLGAFHDREVDGAAAGQIQSHLSACTSCSTELAELQTVSRLLESAEVGAMSEVGRARLHAMADKAAALHQRDLFPVARALLAVAASILVIAGAWLFELPDRATPNVTTVVRQQAAEDWEKLAQGEEPSRTGAAGSATDVAVKWMIDGLQINGGNP